MRVPDGTVGPLPQSWTWVNQGACYWQVTQSSYEVYNRIGIDGGWSQEDVLALPVLLLTRTQEAHGRDTEGDPRDER